MFLFMKDVLISVSINFERLPCNCKHSGPVHITPEQFKKGVTYGPKLLNADRLRQSAFLLNLESTFGNQEGMIT